MATPNGPLLLAALCGFACACTYNTNKPTNFGQSPEQPPAKAIARTPKQWCLDYCNRLRACTPENADAAFAECKKQHNDCDVEQVTNVLCCAELTTCGDFFQCSKEGAPAGC